MKNTYSFDVFDTCLCRLCGEPRLLFDVLSLKVQKAAKEACSEHLRQLFVAARATASGSDLSEIYSNVAKSYPLPLSVEGMVQLELETEKEMLVPIVATKQLIDDLRKKGDIIFISDMYLPSAFIRDRLVEHGFFHEGDRLYVSDELQAWKYDGSLYKLIHEKENITYRRWHHYGDNHRSDYVVPRRLGIHANHLHYDYLPYEEQWRQKPVLQYQYPAILAGVARAVRLSSDAPEDQKAFVCNISAPLMVSWVLHIMNDAQSRGIKRLYFCARDVHTEYLIARNLQKLFHNITAHYLFISMQSMENEENILNNYFKQVGLLSSEKNAMVDSNSSGNTLIKLNSIASKYHFNSTYGYYISGWNPATALSPTNTDRRSLNYLILPEYIKHVTPSTVRRLSGMRILFELILSLNYHKRTIGYEFHGNTLRPVFSTDTDDAWYINGTNIKQAKYYNDKLAVLFSEAMTATGLYHFNRDILSQIVIPTIIEFIDSPRKQYLKYLHRFIWGTRPFVGRLLGKQKGVWKRGNFFYTLPSPISSILRFIFSSAILRRQVNHIISSLRR